MEYSSYNVNTPQWREITVGSHLPAELRKLAEIAHNLWWTWNDDAKKLYCDLDSELWKEVEQNPVLFLERINYEKLVALAHDENFVYKWMPSIPPSKNTSMWNRITSARQ